MIEKIKNKLATIDIVTLDIVYFILKSQIVSYKKLLIECIQVLLRYTPKKDIEEYSWIKMLKNVEEITPELLDTAFEDLMGDLIVLLTKEGE